jgi:hypothetical protein
MNFKGAIPASTADRIPPLALAPTRLVTTAKGSRRAVIAPCLCVKSLSLAAMPVCTPADTGAR